MLVRIVKMKFKEERIEKFLENFDQIKDKIRGFEGCQLLELYRDKNDKCIFFTYSYWDSEKQLNMYRASPMFEEVWKETKSMFAEKAEAWSLDKLRSLE